MMNGPYLPSCMAAMPIVLLRIWPAVASRVGILPAAGR